MSGTSTSPAPGRGTSASMLVIALVVLLAACAPGAPDGAGSASPSAPGDGGSPSGARTSPGDDASVARRFPIVAYHGAELLGGEELDFTELLGRGMPVALNFWAGQCPPCRAEMPAFQRVYDSHRDDFLLVGVDIGPFIGLGSQDDARALLAELNITYPTAYAVDDRAVRDYNIISMPTTIFYTADGAEHSRHNGLMTEEQFEEAVEQVAASG